MQQKAYYCYMKAQNRIKKPIRKIFDWFLRVTIVGLIAFIALVVFIFNPEIVYAKQHSIAGWQVLSEQSLDLDAWEAEILKAQNLIKQSEIYDPSYSFRVCLNDQKYYPKVVNRLLGNGFAHGFGDLIVLHTEDDAEAGCAHLNGYDWELSRLLAHEAVHGLQYHRLGLFKSNPIANIPNWKWEGYAEYIARADNSLGDFQSCARTARQLLASKNQFWVAFENGSGMPSHLFQDYVKVRFCLEVEKQSWIALLADARSEAEIGKVIDLYVQRGN